MALGDAASRAQKPHLNYSQATCGHLMDLIIIRLYILINKKGTMKNKGILLLIFLLYSFYDSLDKAPKLN